MKPNIEAKLCAAALRLVAKRNWASLTLEQIAAAAKVSPAQAKQDFSGRDRLLPAIVRHIDTQSLTHTGKLDARSKPHDRLFQLLMARFDVLQESRDGILSIQRALRGDPSLARFIVPAQMQFMQKLIEKAGVAKGPRAQIATFGLLAIYYRALWSWQNDPSKDMAKTMAALDQGLRCAGRLAEIIFRDSK